jgi:hypothetical protein
MGLVLGQQISTEDILSYTGGGPKILVLRFQADGFDGAALTETQGET